MRRTTPSARPPGGAWLPVTAVMTALAALLLLAPEASARRTRFIQSVIVTSEGTSAPFGGGEWEQVQNRDKLDAIIQHQTPSYRNFWLPVPYSEALLATDTTSIVSYYRNNGYLDAHVASATLEPVETDRSGSLYSILIVVGGVEERQRYRLTRLQFDGATALDTVSLTRSFSRRHGRAGFFSPGAAVDNLLALRIEYADAGYLDSSSVRITQEPIVDRDNRSVIERYAISERRPVRIGGFRIASAEPLHTQEAVILSALADAGLEPGRVLGRRRIVDGETNLLELGIFRKVRVYPDTVTVADAPWIRQVVIELSESDPGQVHTRAGFTQKGSGRTWRLVQSVTYGNLLGQARLIGAEGELRSDRQSVAIVYGQPTVGFPRFVPLVGGMSARFRHDQQLGVDWEEIDATSDTDSTAQQTVNRTIGTTATVSRRYGRVARVGLSLELGRTDADISGRLGSGATSSIRSVLTLHGTYDSRDQFLNPRRGVVANARFSIVGLDPFARRPIWVTELMAGSYRRINRRVLLALTAAGGFIYGTSGTDITDVENESFWKSSQTSPVRGFRRDDVTELSPAYAYWLAKAELRFSVWKIIGAAAFADVGSGWSFDANQRGWSALERKATMASVGAGPRLNWVLPIRLDFVRQLTNPLASTDDASGLVRGTPSWKVEFGIGHAF